MKTLTAYTLFLTACGYALYGAALQALTGLGL